MIVDDDPGQLQLMTMFLSQQGYEIFTAGDGTEATRMVAKVRPDIILLDVCLPGMDGYATCQKLKEVTLAPVIFFSAKTSESDIIEGFKSGGDDYITKPLHLRELVLRMETRLKNASQPPQIKLYQDRSLTVDLQRKKVVRNGNSIHLTPLEYKLLVCLVRHAGEVVSHKVILKEVWGHCYMDGITNLSLYIHYLREKLEDDPENPVYIRSEWGSGYWFSVQNEE